MRFSTFRSWVAGLCVLALAGCGGGGGGGESLFGGGASDAPVLAVALTSITVTAAAPSQVTATVTTAAGAPLPGQLVSFKTTLGLGSFSSPSALTNAEGKAFVFLTPALAANSGADEVVATVTVNELLATARQGFQLTATDIVIDSFDSDLATLPPYGQTVLTVRLRGTTPGIPVAVAISSACVTKGRATLTPASASVTTGSATFTYRDQGCGAFDAVDGLLATLTGTSISRPLQIGLTSPSASSIALVSTTPSTIYLKGSGFVENSAVTFEVRDANGAAVPNQTVVLEATTLAGGITIDGVTGPLTKRSDTNGQVIVRVNAGTIPTPVRVKASLQLDGAVTAVSSNLSIATGLPTQNSFSVSQGTLNIEGYNFDGTSNTFKVIASDRLGNPVPDGTAINFITESGQVQSTGFTATAGGLSQASVAYQSASPRPIDGRMTTLIYALGEESFLDRNGNNIYDPGEDYQDLGELYLDRLFNGSFNALEDQFIATPVAGTDLITGSDACNVANSPLLQLTRQSPSRTVTQAGVSVSSCRAGWGRAYVRSAVQTILSTSAARPIYGLRLPGSAVATSVGSCDAGAKLLINPVGGGSFGIADGYNADDTINLSTFYEFGSVALANLGKTGTLGFVVADGNPVALNPMAAGTTISATGTQGLSAAVVGGSPVPSTLAPTGAAVNFSFDDTTADGTITVTFRSPGGLATSYSQRVFKNAPLGYVACP
ncbi:MAG: Ig-like domain-containing protein [Aquabacterium sp.]|nr:Ig-like domain-containing protein [Aquabacterium sp.]